MAQTTYKYKVKVKRTVGDQEKIGLMWVMSDGTVDIDKPDDQASLQYLIEKLEFVQKMIPWMKDVKTISFEITREVQEAGVNP